MTAHFLISALLGAANPSGNVAASADPIVLDGDLGEAAWKGAPRHELGYQKEPRSGQAPSETTTWQAVVVGDKLYVGVRADAENAKIVARRTRRDRAVESDRVTVDIDMRGRGQDAFHFEVTAGGSLVDGIRYNDTVLDLQWDGYWDAAVVVDEDGWTAEIEIPLRLLRRPDKETATVHVQVRRYISALGETDEWAPTPRDKSREVSAYAPVDGLRPSPKRLRFDVLPYGAVGASLRTPSSRLSTIRRAGADAKLQIGNDASIDASLFPDFGTVEADTAVFNLNPVELRFPEKRSFFLEGTDVFNTPLEVFYSRRIGSLSGATAGTSVSAPPPAPVVGAGKFLARGGRRWSVGALLAGTGEQETRVRDAGVIGPQRVAPGTLYGAFRVRRELAYGSHVGVLATSRTSFERGPSPPFTACPDRAAPVRGSCFADTYVAGPDARVRSKNGKWAGTGQAVGSYRFGGTPSVNPDGTRLESDRMGGATRAKLEKTGGRMIGWLRHEWYSENVDYNASGFLPRGNHHFMRGQVGVQTLTPHGSVLEDRWQVEVFQRLSLDGVPMGSGYQVNHRARWKNFWRSFIEFHFRPSYFDNREARDGTLVERAGLVGLELDVQGDPRRTARGSWESTYQQRTNGLRAKGEAAVDLNLSGAVQLRLGVEGTVDRGEPRWLGTEGGQYRFARLDAHALGVLTRLNYTITPKLELQGYAQLLGVGTNYTGGRTFPTGVGRVRLSALRTDASFGGQHGNEALVVANLFLRWEYAVGSNVYLVATRNQVDAEARSGAGGLDFASVRQSRADYTFLVKFTRLLTW